MTARMNMMPSVSHQRAGNCARARGRSKLLQAERDFASGQKF
jgi:hypothetical protein